MSSFSEHPIQAYDPFYTRDINLWNCSFDDYRCDIKQRAKLANTRGNRRELNAILSEWVDTLYKIYAYERATGTLFLSHYNSSGRMRHPSPMAVWVR